MEESFFDHSTEHDSPAALIFFADLLISKHEPAQTYQVIDEKTGALKSETITPGKAIISVAGDNVAVLAPDIPTNGGPQGIVQVQYIPYPVAIILPESGTDRIEIVQFTIDNIDRSFVDILRRLQFPLKVNVAVGYVLPANENRITGICHRLERRFSGLDLVDVVITPEVITGQLIVDNILWKKYPNNHETYEHENFPGLWGLDPDDP